MQSLTIAEANRIRDYCAEEVRRQGRGPDRVPGMFEAWMDALHEQYVGEPLNARMVTRWAAMIEPNYNYPDEWRGVDVMLTSFTGETVIPPHSVNVPRLMLRFFEHVEDMEALEAYKEFERIHPFEDGNGRTGKIILNWLNGTLLDPIFPPSDIFGYEISNP